MGRKGLPISYHIAGICFAMWASQAMADPDLKILSPVDGAVIKSGQSIDVVYDINPHRGGDHSHIYIDQKEVGILRKKKATFPLNVLPSGEHSLCLKVVNRAHAPIGQETCIKVVQE